MYKCIDCNKEFINRHSYSGHRTHCLGKVNYEKIRSFKNKDKGNIEWKSKKEEFINGIYICLKCKKEFKKCQSLQAHKSHCLVENRKQHKFTEEERKNGQENRKINFKLGKIKLPKQNTSEKTKKIQREKRIKFMIENPEKTAYSRKNKGEKSYPEKIFEEAFKKNNILNYQYNYQFGIYRYDFAFVKEKIDVEIDGSQHLLAKNIQKDKIRDDFSNKNGWSVLRFTSKQVLNNVNECILILEEKLNIFR